MFSLWTGSYWAGLAPVLARQIILKRQIDPLQHFLIVVPSQASRHWLERQLARHLDNDLSGIKTLTLHQFALESLRRMNGPAIEVSEDKRYLALVWEILQNDSQGFRYPEHAPFATVRALYALMRELRDAAVHLEETQWLASDEPYEGIVERQKFHAQRVFRFYERYCAEMNKRSWVDSPQMVMTAAQISQQCLKEQKWPFVALWGFDELLGSQKLLIQALIFSAQEAQIYIPEDAFTSGLITEAQGWGFKRQRLENDQSIPSAPAAYWRLPAPKDEAWVIVKQLRAWAKKGISWGDMAVVYQGGQQGHAFLAMELQNQAIPMVGVTDPMEILSAKPLGDFLAAALDFWEAPTALNAAALIDRSVSFGEPTMKIWIKVVIGRLLSLAARQRTRWRQEGTFDDVIKKLCALEQDCPLERRGELPGLVRPWIDYLDEALDPRVQSGGRHLKEWLFKAVEGSWRSEQDDVLARLGEFLESLSPSALKHRSFARQMILEAIGSLQLDEARVAHRAGGVWLLTPNEARAGEWSALIIAGVNDGQYPQAPQEDPFLSDAVRRRLNDLGFGFKERRPKRNLGFVRFKDSLRGPSEDEHLLRLMACSAEKQLLLTGVASGYDGKPRSPSPYLELFFKNLTPLVLTNSQWKDRWQFLQRAGLQENPEELLNKSERLSLAQAIENASEKFPEVPQRRLTLPQWRSWRERFAEITPTALGGFLSCPQAFLWRRYDGAAPWNIHARSEFFPDTFLGEAFGQAAVAFLKDDRLTLVQAWRAAIQKGLAEVATADLPAGEEYKFRRLEGVIEDFQKDLAKIRSDIKINEEVTAEKKFKFLFPVANENAVLSCRADAAIGEGRLIEFKLKRKPAIEAQGHRKPPSWPLEKLLSLKNADGPRYGLQVLFYLMVLRNNAPGADVLLGNPYWEIWTKAAPPVVRRFGRDTWDVKFEVLLSEWIKLWSQGLPHDDQVFFPWNPQDEQNGRCSWCSFQRACLKNIPAIRAARLSSVQQWNQAASPAKEQDNDDD